MLNIYIWHASIFPLKKFFTCLVLLPLCNQSNEDLDVPDTEDYDNILDVILATVMRVQLYPCSSIWIKKARLPCLSSRRQQVFH